MYSPDSIWGYRNFTKYGFWNAFNIIFELFLLWLFKILAVKYFIIAACFYAHRLKGLHLKAKMLTSNLDVTLSETMIFEFMRTWKIYAYKN